VSGLCGSLTDIISNDGAVGPAIVSIAPTDKGFDSEGCGNWARLPMTGTNATSFGDGTWAVGFEIAPGTCVAPGGSECYWSRPSAFGAAGITGVIANDNPVGSVVVAMPPQIRVSRLRIVVPGLSVLRNAS
jgi:hypothetical protein